MKKCIIIGGGASGMMAAITAAKAGYQVTLLEKNKRIGKKVLVTGNGRCNLTNKHISIKNYHSFSDLTMYDEIMKQFGLKNTLEFLNQLGLCVVEGVKGKMYPRSLQASSVVEAFLMELNRLKVNVLTETEVVEITHDSLFHVKSKNNKVYKSQVVIMTTGGQASPDLGGGKSGYILANQLNHTCTPLLPGIIQLKARSPYLKSLKGTKVNGAVKLVHQGEILAKSSGEILYTDYGLSGPAILDISSKASRLLADKKNLKVTLDICPEMPDLDQVIVRRLDYAYKKNVQEFLVGFINKRLIIPVLKSAEIDIHKKACELSKKERKSLIKGLKEMSFDIIGTNQWNQAQVTIGGIKLKEINPTTLESKLHKNLYFAGEIMDVDGDCGGYNLQWAFSTGYVAGRCL